MISEDDFHLLGEQLDRASSEVRNQWGAEIDDKLENLLEYQILAEESGFESTESQKVIVHYKPTKSFDNFLNEFEELEESYEKRGEEFECQEFDEFESIANEAIASLLEELPNAETGEHLRLGNAVVANLIPAQIKQIASRSDVEQIELDKPIQLELDQSAISVGVVNARTKGLAGTGKGVIIAVLDGEVDINHPDLKGRVVHKRNYTNEKWGNPHSHGTHVAGIIAGNGSKYKGMAPGAIIWSYKIFPTNPQEESTGSKGADAIEDVVKDMQQEKRLRIANCSWGVSSPTLDGNSAVSETAERATRLGLVLVKSAGNEGTKRPGPGSITLPADARGDVIVVGASSRDSTRVIPFSSRGPTSDERPKPDILAPGEAIMSAKLGSGYVRQSGTSMASPHIAGIAALILERYPQLQPWQVKKILMQSAKKLDAEFDENAQGVGLVDAAKALLLAGEPIANAEQVVTPRPTVNKWKLLEQVNIPLRNIGYETMQGVKASLVAPKDIKVTSAERDYGTLRPGAEITRNFAIEVPSNLKSPQYKLTLNVNFTTPKGKQTRSYKLTHKVPILQR